MAYIIERKKRFYVVAYDGLDPSTGQERRRWHTAGHSRADAESIAARRFMQMRRQRLQSTTADRYEWTIDNGINPALGSMPLRSVDPSTSTACTATSIRTGDTR